MTKKNICKFFLKLLIISFFHSEISFSDETQIIKVDAGKVIGPSKLRQGFVHGLTYTKGKDYSKTIELISALKPKSWRMSNYDNNVYDFVFSEGQFPQKMGTEIVFNFQDVFNAKYGWNVRVGRLCLGRASNCFRTFSQFKKTWLEVVDKVMKTVEEKNPRIDYFDIFSEPNWGTGSLGLSPSEFEETFKETHDLIRKYKPNAKIVAPSIVSYGEKILLRLLKFTAEKNLRLDAVSWHEFGDPEVLPAHVNFVRDIFKKYPGLCVPTCPEIHINEYENEDQHLIPGAGVAWLYYLEKSNVDQANRGCWDLPGTKETTCWSGFNGFLLSDNITPRPLYWVYKSYAELNDSRVAVEISNSHAIAIATKDPLIKELQILMGSFGQKNDDNSIKIEIKNFFENTRLARVEYTLISKPKDILAAMPKPPVSKIQSLPVRNGVISISLSDLHDGDAVRIMIRPQ